MTARRIRVLIVDDHTLIREGLRAILALDPGLEVGGLANDAERALELAMDHGPDVVLMDFRLGGRNGVDAAVDIRRALPAMSIVFLSADDSDDTLSAAVKAGAAGFLAKTAPMNEVVGAIHRAAAGEILIPAQVLAELLTTERARLHHASADAAYGRSLTGRERQILQLTAEGVDNFGIAQRLFIELTTVRWHVRNILEKLAVHSKLEAVARAAEHGLILRPVKPSPHP